MEYQYASPNNSRFIECANPGWGSTFFPERVLNITEDQCASRNNTTEGSTFFANSVTEDEDEDEDEDEYFDVRQIYKLPRPKELMKSNEKDYYTPKIVSFGPYYHDKSKSKLGMAQELKQTILTMQISKWGKDKKVFYRQIFKRINKIRNCYLGVSEDEWDDGALTEMMLLDASFAACIMMSSLKEFRQSEPLITIEEELGYDVIPFIRKDMLLLDNQIPLWVIMRFFKLIFGKEQDVGRNILHAFVNQMARLHSEISSIPEEDGKLPLHLLDAIYRVLVQHVEKGQCFGCKRKKEDPSIYSAENRQFRSVTDLKAKGIDCKPSSQCLNDIDFKSKLFTGELQLPVLFFHQYSKKLFTNLVAYELHPKRSARPKQRHSPGAVSAYVNFLKSLVIKPEDVRELRERKILFSSLDGDEKVLQVIKEIFITRGDYELQDVKMSIEAHCSNFVKTSIGKLKHTFVRNPWVIILLTAAGLILTFLQTYNTMKYHN